MKKQPSANQPPLMAQARSPSAACSEIGYHVHTGDSETYYILSGCGRYNDNGTITTVSPGDVAYCAPGEGHGLACVGDEPIEMIALILYQ